MQPLLEGCAGGVNGDKNEWASCVCDAIQYLRWRFASSVVSDDVAVRHGHTLHKMSNARRPGKVRESGHSDFAGRIGMHFRFDHNPFSTNT
jgi:hypothetical protein